MLSFPSVIIVLLICVVSNAQEGPRTTVSLYTQNNVVTQDETITLQCEIRNPPESSIVSFLRQTAINNERLTWGESLIDPGFDRIYLSEKQAASPDTREFVLTIYKAAVEDEGEYVCEVYDGATYDSIGESRVQLRVQQGEVQPPPGPGPVTAVPVCTSNPDLSRPVYVGTSIDLLCQIGDSKANIEWSKENRKIPEQVTYNENGVITSRLIRTVTANDDASLFICSVMDQSGEGEKCYVGPLVVSRDPGQPTYTKKPDHGEYTEKVHGSTKTKRVIDRCMAFCSALVDLE